MATLMEMPSHPGSGAVAVEVVGSRRGGGTVSTGDAWEERTYVMQFTNTTWNTVDARNANGIPADNSALGLYALYVDDKQVEPDPADQTIVRVRVMYKTLKPNERQPHINATESIWSVVKSISFFPTEEEVQRDITGKICVNVLGEPIQPPINQLVMDAKLSISFFTNASDSQFYALNTQQYVNSNAFTITIGACPYVVAPGTCYFLEHTASDAWDNGSRCSDIRMEMLLRADNGSSSWHEFRPNLSLCESISTGAPAAGRKAINVPTIQLSSSGGTVTQLVPIADPVYLDATGRQIAAGGTIVLNDFTIRGTANFTQLLSGLLT